MLSKEQKDYLVIKAYNAAIRAGAAILDVYNGSAEIAIDFKSDRSPLIKADLSAHTSIKNYLGQTHIPLLSEEGRDLLYEERQGWDLFWLVDPLDGTKEFIKGNGEFTVNIALMYNNKPEIGVIYVPYINKIYFAVNHNGAYLKNGVKPEHDAEYSLDQIWEGVSRLPLSTQRNNPLRIAVSRSHSTPQTKAHIESIIGKYPGAEVVEQGSSYKLCLLAEGAVDTYARHTDTYEWDTAAGDIILSEAGGSMRCLDGNKLEYNKESLVNPHFVCNSRFFEN